MLHWYSRGLSPCGFSGCLSGRVVEVMLGGDGDRGHGSHNRSDHGWGGHDRSGYGCALDWQSFYGQTFHDSSRFDQSDHGLCDCLNAPSGHGRNASYTATCMVYTATTSVAPMLLSTVLFRVITPRSNCAGHSSLDPPQRRCRPQLPLLVLTFPVLSAAVAVTVSEQQHFTAI